MFKSNEEHNILISGLAELGKNIKKIETSEENGALNEGQIVKYLIK